MAMIKAVLGFLVILAAVWAVFQIAPPIMANFNFQDDLKNVALMDSASLQKTDDDIRNDVLRRAKEHDLPIEPKQVTVQRLNSPGIAAVYVAADYSVTVNLPGYSFNMHFNPDSGNK
ncbi:MAG: hypothetical protein ABSF97_20940 [Candidatus Sulfotelmatobacter sp.]|jgi:hypothetical protein